MNIRKPAVFIARVCGGSGGPEDARSRRSVALRLLLRRAAKVVDGHLSFTNKKHHLRLRKDSSLRLGGSLDEVHLQERLEVQVGHLVLVRDVVVPGNVLPVFVGS